MREKMLRTSFTIGKKVIGKGRTFIIAEMGSNHNQNITTAKRLIDVAADAGADAVKFQSIKYDKLYMPEEKNNKIKKLLEQIQLQEDWYEDLTDYCRKKNILFFTAPTYLEAVDILEQLSVLFYKIASPQTATFPQLIEKIALLKKPIIMSTGYLTLDEINNAVTIVEKNRNVTLALLHCVSEYPTEPNIANLRFINTLKQKYHIPVGFSDHTLGWAVTLAAVALGADIIEKHLTLSRKQSGPDHFFAMTPPEFCQMIEDIRKVEQSIGTGKKSQITLQETKLLNILEMKAIVQRDILKGSVLNKKNDIMYRRTLKNGSNAWEIYSVDKVIARKNIKAGSILTSDCIELKNRKK
jgi:sialic acid synthase SpsE